MHARGERHPPDAKEPAVQRLGGIIAIITTRGGVSCDRHASLDVILTLCLAATLLVACKKSACELGHPAPVAFPWDKHQDLVPPGAKVCGVADRGSGATNTLVMSFPKDDNPWVTTVKQLEDKGWTRTSQETKNPDLLMATLRKGDDEINLVAERLSGYENQVRLDLHTRDCSGAAKDGSACRGSRQIIKCQARSWIADGPTCAQDEICATNAANGAAERADTAHCVKR